MKKDRAVTGVADLIAHAIRWVWLAVLVAVPSAYAADSVAWKLLYQGVFATTLKRLLPRPLYGAALRIDLRDPDIRFFVTPASDGEGQTLSEKTTTFLKRNQLQAAINATPFEPVYDQEGLPETVWGLLVSQGQLVSRPGRLPALLIDRHNRARIQKGPVRTAGVWNGVGGISVVLWAGQPKGRSDDGHHPRTAVGISRDGRWMYWLVVDGRQPGYSEGATTRELAGLLKQLGAWSGLNLDGGGTSAMAVETPKGPMLLNRPVHRGWPGGERPAGAHLGVRAQSLDAPPVPPQPPDPGWVDVVRQIWHGLFGTQTP